MMNVRCSEGRSGFKGRGLGRAPLAGPIFPERRFRVRHRSAGGQHYPQSSPSFSFQIGPRATWPNPPTSCRRAFARRPATPPASRTPPHRSRSSNGTFGRWVDHPDDMPTRRQHKARLRARQLCDPPGRTPGHDVVLLSADRVDVLPNSAQIDGLTEKREFARLDQIVLEIGIVKIEAVRPLGHTSAVAVPV